MMFLFDGWNLITFTLFRKKIYLIKTIRKKKQVFQSLRRHEVIGIHVKKEWYNNITITEYPLPPEYLEMEHVIKCANYPNSNEVDDFVPFLSTLDSTLSQVTEIGTEMDAENDNMVLQFVSDNVTATISQTNTENSFYSQLKPNFSEAVNWITSQDDVDKLKRLFDNFISEMKICTLLSIRHLLVKNMFQVICPKKLPKTIIVVWAIRKRRNKNDRLIIRFHKFLLVRKCSGLCGIFQYEVCLTVFIIQLTVSRIDDIMMLRRYTLNNYVLLSIMSINSYWLENAVVYVVHFNTKCVPLYLSSNWQ